MSFLARPIFSQNTPSPDYIIRSDSGILNPDLYDYFGTSSTLMDDDASYENIVPDYIFRKR
jgi:hypothetical protein